MNFNVSFPENGRLKLIYNDGNFGEDAVNRKYMVYIECTMVAKSAEAPLPAEARKWTGERSIATTVNKRQYQYIGRENCKMVINEELINTKMHIFKGCQNIPDFPPSDQFRLWPSTGTQRTLFA